MKNPCRRECQRRCPGCAATCPDWAKYVEARDAGYKDRLLKSEVTTALIDGKRRVTRT